MCRRIATVGKQFSNPAAKALQLRGRGFGTGAQRDGLLRRGRGQTGKRRRPESGLRQGFRRCGIERKNDIAALVTVDRHDSGQRILPMSFRLFQTVLRWAPGVGMVRAKAPLASAIIAAKLNSTPTPNFCQINPPTSAAMMLIR